MGGLACTECKPCFVPIGQVVQQSPNQASPEDNNKAKPCPKRRLPLVQHTDMSPRIQKLSFTTPRVAAQHPARNEYATSISSVPPVSRASATCFMMAVVAARSQRRCPPPAAHHAWRRPTLVAVSGSADASPTLGSPRRGDGCTRGKSLCKNREPAMCTLRARHERAQGWRAVAGIVRCCCWPCSEKQLPLHRLHYKLTPLLVHKQRR